MPNNVSCNLFKDGGDPDHFRVVSPLDYAIHPFVVHPSHDSTLKNKHRTILLNAHTKQDGKKLLDKMVTGQYVPFDDKAYDSIRGMKK